ncbi:hypothetical protein [Nocardia concava]|uniref:hypothetical protein n=1 Tax=Nocardia concava TaxID=257281 RepID=UPI0003109F4E|nr:hypothetical protein [Nocardia concava]
MRRHGRLTREQLQLSFESALSRALTRGTFRTHTGLDFETRNALKEIARAHPNVTDDLVAAAHRAFAGQLDGSNSARALAEQNRKLTEAQERLKRQQPMRAGMKSGNALLWLDTSPSYFRFRTGTIQLEESERELSGQRLNVRTGAFEPASAADIDAVLKPTADLDYSALTGPQFVWATEQARSLYLRGSGRIFDLYHRVNETFTAAEQEHRRITPSERSGITDMYRKTFRLWADEFARRAAGEPPTFHYSWVGDPR